MSKNVQTRAQSKKDNDSTPQNQFNSPDTDLTSLASSDTTASIEIVDMFVNRGTRLTNDTQDAYGFSTQHSDSGQGDEASRNRHLSDELLQQLRMPLNQTAIASGHMLPLDSVHNKLQIQNSNSIKHLVSQNTDNERSASTTSADVHCDSYDLPANNDNNAHLDRFEHLVASDLCRQQQPTVSATKQVYLPDTLVRPSQPDNCHPVITSANISNGSVDKCTNVSTVGVHADNMQMYTTPQDPFSSQTSARDDRTQMIMLQLLDVQRVMQQELLRDRQCTRERESIADQVITDLINKHSRIEAQLDAIAAQRLHISSTAAVSEIPVLPTVYPTCTDNARVVHANAAIAQPTSQSVVNRNNATVNSANASFNWGSVYQPPQFDGDAKSDLELFLTRFQMQAEEFNWDDQKKMRHMHFALNGKAALLLSQHVGLSFNDFVTKLRQAYGSVNENTCQQYEAALHMYKRKAGETPQQMRIAMEAIANKAFPGEQDTRHYRISLRDAFVDALGNPDIEVEVWRTNPQTIAEAVIAASQIEVLFAKKRLPSTVGATHCNQTVQRHVDDKPMRALGDDRQSNDVTTRLDCLEKMIFDLPKQLAMFYSANFQSLPAGTIQPVMNNRFSGSNGFTQKPAYVPVNDNEQQTTDQKACFHCKIVGHWKKDCPQLAPDIRTKLRLKYEARKTMFSNSNGLSAATVNPGNDIPVPRLNRLVYGDGHNCYFMIYIDGQARRVLADTGCAISVIPAKLVPPSMHIVPVNTQACAVNSSSVRLTGQVCLNFRLEPNGKEYKHVVYITPDISEFIFGLKWLTSMNFNWQCKQGKLELDGSQLVSV